CDHLAALNDFRFNTLIPSAIEDKMLSAVWTKTQTGTKMELTIPDFSRLKRNFGGFNFWGGIRVISLTEKRVFDSYTAQTEIFDVGSTGEVVFDFPELDMTDDAGEIINPEDIAVV